MNGLKLIIKGAGLNLSSDMAYKWNFFINFIATALKDAIGPLIILLIYSRTSGIPGWSFYEFLLFQGTLTFVFGFGHFLFVSIPANIIRNVRKGSFDQFMLKPVNVLFYLTSTSFDWDGFAEILVGMVLIAISIIKLNLAVFSSNFLVYLMLVLLGILFQYALMILIAAASFVLVQSWALLDLAFKLTDFARYPSTIYGFGLRFFLTFLFPISISAFYPVEVLLKGANMMFVLQIAIPVIAFFFLSLYLWKKGLKKYSSAGG